MVWFYLRGVTKVVRKLFGSKVPGVDEVCPEKALDIGLSWLTHLFSVTWKTVTLPVEWQTGWWFTFSKRDTGGCDPIIGVSHCSASSGKIFPRYLKRMQTDCRIPDLGVRVWILSCRWNNGPAPVELLEGHGHSTNQSTCGL